MLKQMVHAVHVLLLNTTYTKHVFLRCMWDNDEGDDDYVNRLETYFSSK